MGAVKPVKKSLAALHPKNTEVPVLILTAFIALIYGLTLPVITLKELVFWKHTFSVVTGIKNLYEEKYFVLAGVIFLFSVLFPFFKLSTLWTLWFFRMAPERRQFLLKWLGILGKWSMLDVFVVAVTLVISKISYLAKAEAHAGIYVFGLSVMLSMITTFRMEQLTRKTV